MVLNELKADYGNVTCSKVNQPHNRNDAAYLGLYLYAAQEYFYGFTNLHEQGILEWLPTMETLTAMQEAHRLYEMAVYAQNENSPTPLSLSINLFIVFYVLLVLLGISIVVFTLELITSKVSKMWTNFIVNF